ncbi:MAG: polyamine aminopropyltransferase, partial [Gammaproteobacteria bacterium]|nr:polyamine aminopropyltransferase [Gammaproteobacteria bacterium]
MDRFTEELEPGYFQGFAVDRVILDEKTDLQHLVIFENRLFGRIMALDGIIQTTEKDEFIYHEMIAHVPLMSHAAPRRVLIVGGGDGGTLREVLRHPDVEHVVQVEIDAGVIDTCRRYFPNHSQGAFDNPRAEIIIDDGFDYVATSDQRFDVIITDSTDAVGPGAVLFSRDYYAGCRRCLADGGVLVTQNGVAFLQMYEVRPSAQYFSELFQDAHFYGAAVPTYVGGIMLFGWATDDMALRTVSI